MLWQLRHCLFWSTSAPWSSSGVLPRTYCTGVGTALQASIFGDQGTITPSQASVVTVRTMRMTLSTATGRRFQLFSPVPATNGTRKSSGDGQRRSHEEERGLRPRRQEGEEREEGEEVEVRLGRGVDEGGIGHTSGAVGAEDGGAERPPRG